MFFKVAKLAPDRRFDNLVDDLFFEQFLMVINFNMDLARFVYGRGVLFQVGNQLLMLLHVGSAVSGRRGVLFQVGSNN
jgi:hypothetical protein